jgi:hypothetical protein
MIKKGDCKYFQDTIKSLREVTDYNYEFLTDRLSKNYNRMLLNGELASQPNKKQKIEHTTSPYPSQQFSYSANQTTTLGRANQTIGYPASNQQQAHSSNSSTQDTTTIQRTTCPTCGKFHRGPCWYSGRDNGRRYDGGRGRGRGRGSSLNRASGYALIRQQLADMTNKYQKLEHSVAQITGQPPNKSTQSQPTSFIEFVQSHSANMVTTSEDEENHRGLCSDTGASITMTPDVWRIRNFQPSHDTVRVADGRRLEVIGTGELGPIKNVLVVPQLRDTLISTSQLDEMGGYTVYGGGKVVVYDGPPTDPESNIIWEGKLQPNGLYFFSSEHQNQANLTTRRVTYADIENSRNRMIPSDDELDTPTDDEEHTDTVADTDQSMEEVGDRTKRWQDLHKRTGLSKRSLHRLVTMEGSNGLNITKDELPGLSMENSEEWYKGQMKAMPLKKGEQGKRKKMKHPELVATDIGSLDLSREQETIILSFSKMLQLPRYFRILGSRRIVSNLH